MPGSTLDQNTFSRRRMLALAAGSMVGSGLLVGLSACSATPTTAPTTAPKPATTTPPKAAPTEAPKPAATAAATAAPTAAPKLEQTRLKIVAVTGLYENVYARLGVDKGIYKKYGVDAEFIEVPSGNQQVQAVVSGEADWAESGLAAPLAAIEQGAALKLFGAPRPRINFIFISSRDIQQPTDLYGKNIGTAATGSQLHTLAMAYLYKQNLDPSKVTFVNIGSSPDVARAVFTGKVDAGPVTNDWGFELANYPNVKVLSNLSEEMPGFLRVAVHAQTKMVDSEPVFMTAAAIAYSESLRYALEHRDETVALSMKLTGQDRVKTEQIFDLYQKDRQINPSLDFTAEQIAYMQDLHVKLGVQKTVMPTEKLMDRRYIQAVEAKLGKYTPKS